MDVKPTLREAFSDAARDRFYEVDQTGRREADQTEKRALEIDPIRASGRILPSLIGSSPWTLPPAEAEPLRRRARGASSNNKRTKPVIDRLLEHPNA